MFESSLFRMNRKKENLLKSVTTEIGMQTWRKNPTDDLPNSIVNYSNNTITNNNADLSSSNNGELIRLTEEDLMRADIVRDTLR